MPPARSNKRQAPPGGSASAAAGRAAAAAPGEQPANAERGLQPALVKEFLEMIQRRDRLGPEFMNDDERRQWDEYLDSVPASAAESADGRLHWTSPGCNRNYLRPTSSFPGADFEVCPQLTHITHHPKTIHTFWVYSLWLR